MGSLYLYLYTTPYQTSLARYSSCVRSLRSQLTSLHNIALFCKVQFEVIAAVFLNTRVFMNVTSSQLVKIYKRFKGYLCLHLQCHCPWTTLRIIGDCLPVYKKLNPWRLASSTFSLLGSKFFFTWPDKFR